MTELEPEEIIYKAIKDVNYDIQQINLSKSKEFFTYHDYHLHARTFWPETPPKAIVLFIHGYISHINRPTHGYLGPFFKSKGIAFVGFDFPGHGYSNGERALVNSVEELIDIALHAVETFYDPITTTENYHIERPYTIDHNTPLILMGHSMGGATAILISEHLQQSKYNFIGSIYLCPAIKIPALPGFLRFLLDYVLAPLFPLTPIPPFLNKEFNPKNTWNNDDYIEYVKADHYPQNPNGLGWGGNLRFWSGSTLLHLAETVTASFSTINHPFIMFHDPDDKTVDYTGALEMMEQCSTPKELQELVVLEGSGHDILINRLGVISRKSVEWIEKLLTTLNQKK
mmetsp:Transcript_20782/g.22595  ORF Transcript_20782/g.22595 Transcript_20782/m.22595 type:complete len:342 (-) Transcript_20782:275-1300(-)|eukprot:CAMPEP_0173149162 /NCGR_PEP_ID=MMETSP1105-20130129/10162_1 /TAXON_ID=2985 /ORGANISM="Ochromonas sp., Strain BG-1" /LENGTH=341 /DNA_ID=CAMNT_0014063977 /DNA_START=51 /DNA_END=1076 /DNA_ORIENTATION=+